MAEPKTPEAGESGPYVVEPMSTACDACGHGGTWKIVANDTPLYWLPDEEETRKWCARLNDAYALGAEHAAAASAGERKQLNETIEELRKQLDALGEVGL